MPVFYQESRMLYSRITTVLIFFICVCQSYCYDLDWLESGCDPSSYDEKTRDDNTPGTYITGYAIAVSGLVCALIVLISSQWEGGWMTGYFFFTGLGFGVAALAHQLVDDTDSFWSSINFNVGARIAYALVHLGNAALMFVGIRYFTENIYAKLWWGVSNFTVLILTGYGFKYASVIAGVVINVGMVVVFFIKERMHNDGHCLIAKALGLAIQDAGAVVIVFLNRKCGIE